MNTFKSKTMRGHSLSRKWLILRWMLVWAVFITQNLSAQTRYVDITASGANDGSSWTDAYNQLSTALIAADSDTSIHEILVAQGVYRPAVSNIDSTFGIFRGGLKLSGGYPNGGGVRDRIRYQTVMDGSLGSSRNSRHVMIICGLPASADSVIVDGFVIQNGLANLIGSISYKGNSLLRSAGGGIYIFNCSNERKTVISHCQIKSNRALCISGSFGGYTRGVGGGLFVKSSSPLIYNCLFSGNAGNSIKTMPLDPLSPRAHSFGTALCADDASPAVVNCVFYGNTGGNSTIYSGHTTASYPTLHNCIVYGNTNGITASKGTLTVAYSIIQGGYKGIGNSSSDPLFVYAAGNDFRLQKSSPAIEAGYNTALPAGSYSDYYGGIRILNTTVDMGIHEYGNPSISGPNTLCIGSAMAYPGSPDGGTYSHSNPTVASMGASGLVTALSAGTDTIKYTIGDTTVYKVIEAVTVPKVAASTGPASLCSGSSITVTNDTPGGIWKSSHSYIATVNRSGLVTGVSEGSVNIIYTVTDNGCSDSTVLPITIHKSPVASFEVPDILCSGSILNVIATPAGGTFSHTNPAVIEVDKGLAKGLLPGVDTFKYSVTDVNGCTGTTSKVVTVPPRYPRPVITESGGVLTSSPGSSYLWFLNDIFIPFAVHRTYTPVTPGKYTVEVRLGAYDCPETSAPYWLSSVGIPSAGLSASARLYPNPAADRVHIDAPEIGHVIISSFDGRIVLQAYDSQELDIAGLPAGMYLVTIYNKKGMLLLREKLLHRTP